MKRAHKNDDTVESRLFPRPPRPFKTFREACRMGDLDAMRTFVVGGASASAKFSPHGPTPIVEAVSHRHLPVCQYLMSKGANPYEFVIYTPGRRHRTVQVSAIEKVLRNEDFDLFLAVSNKDPREWGDEPMFAEDPFFNWLMIKLASSFPHPHVFRTLLSWNKLRKHPVTLSYALSKLTDSESWVGPFVKSGLHALMLEELMAVEGNQGNLVKWLDSLPWFEICHQGSFHAVKFLAETLSKEDFETMAKTNLYGQPAFFEAIHRDHTAIVSLIFQNASEVATKMQSSQGDTPLHAAARQQTSVPTFSAVLEYCTNLINEEFEDGDTILHKLASEGNDLATEKVELLCKCKQGSLDVWKRDRQGQTAFARAIRSHKPSRDTLQHLYDVDKTLATAADQNEKGLTPLDYAWKADKVDLLVTLFSLADAGSLLEASRFSRHRGYLRSRPLDQERSSSLPSNKYLDAARKVLQHCDPDETEGLMYSEIPGIDEQPCELIAMLLFTRGIMVPDRIFVDWSAWSGWQDIVMFLEKKDDLVRHFQIKNNSRQWGTILLDLNQFAERSGHPSLAKAVDALIEALGLPLNKYQW